MLTPAEIRKKALSYWDRQILLRAWLTDESLFPLSIACGTPGSRMLSERFAEVRDWISQLKTHSKMGYEIEYKTINHRQLGRQQIPEQIVFPQLDNLLTAIGKRRDFARFCKLAEHTLQYWPSLRPWLLQKPLTALQHADVWSQLLAVCNYFSHHPKPGLYLRQLSIVGVDSKFIEQHRGILSELLEYILSEHDFDGSISGLSQHGFERRFGLLYDQPLIRLRLLDSDHFINDLSDVTVPLTDFCQLELPVQRVFITENKINGLSFPEQNNAMVIFGLGYGVQSLAEVAWLANKEIYYWGDIDTHGFAILSQLRGYFPQTRSFLMDQKTLLKFQHLCAAEADNKRFDGELQHLTAAESELFGTLKDNRLGTNLRLEQERIDFSYLQDYLSGFL